MRIRSAWARTVLLSTVAAAHVVFSCAFSDLVFRLPRDQVWRQIYEGEHDFLRYVDYRTHDLNETARLHAGARYYLSKVYAEFDLDDAAVAFLQHGWKNERGPWRYQAGIGLLEALSQEKRYAQTERIAKEGLAQFENDRHYLYYYLEALYWQKQYGRVLDLLADFRAQIDFEEQYGIKKIRWHSGEAQLWEAVSRYRGRFGRYRSEFERLFFEYSASEYHSRVYGYIIDEPSLVNEFSDWQIDFFRGKHLVAARSYRDAAQAFERAFEKMSVPERRWALTPRTIRDVGRAYFYGGYGKSGRRRLAELGEQLTGDQLATALEWNGRLHIRSERYDQAQEILQSAYRLQPADQILWLIFDAAFSDSFAAGLASMERYGHLMRNRRYYSDIFDRQTSLAVRERQWEHIWRLRDIAIRYGAPYDRARLAVVAAEGVRAGITDLPPDVLRAHLRAELEFARTQPQSAHYAHVAAFMLGKTAVRTFSSSFQYNGQSTLSPMQCDKLIEGYWQFHLFRQGYAQLRECVDYYSADELVAIAKRLYGREAFNYAMRVVDIARSRSDFSFDGAVARILYPRAYAQYIEQIAERNGISPYFFYALIREESYFTSSVSSHAGAIGLGQFIPSTARAVANRMSIATPDLTDPEQNLMLSGFHIRELIDQLDNKRLFALSAYNAGIRRARRWLRLYDDYSDLLKHESIQFTETRHYIRKILVTNIQYAQLYQDIPSAIVIKQYFTDLARL